MGTIVSLRCSCLITLVLSASIKTVTTWPVGGSLQVLKASLVHGLLSMFMFPSVANPVLVSASLR